MSRNNQNAFIEREDGVDGTVELLDCGQQRFDCNGRLEFTLADAAGQA